MLSLQKPAGFLQQAFSCMEFTQMNHCPKCQTTRRPELSHCHGCQFEFENGTPSHKTLADSCADAALAISLAIAAVVVVLNLTLSGVALLNGITKSNSLRFSDAIRYLVYAFISYVIAIVLQRVLKLSK